MRIGFCTPFKPLNHPRPSGDVTIARDLHDFLTSRGHEVEETPHMSTRTIWHHPSRWLPMWQTVQHCKKQQPAPDVWFTYHSYWKAPDIIGPAMQKKGIPYAIFAGSHAEKRRKNLATRAGYQLNLRALQTADVVFCNKHRDKEPLLRVVPPHKLQFVPPGIPVEKFRFSGEARASLRNQWNAGAAPVVLTAAMLREGVKAQGVEHVITACAALHHGGKDVRLVIAGDGPARQRLKTMGKELLGDRITFLGLVDRFSLFKVYSAADIFAFPGINEGLGMVYLEAQCAGLPVVAWDHDGAPEMVRHEETGFITPSFDEKAFIRAIGTLADNKSLRSIMADAARRHVETTHAMTINYTAVENRLQSLIP